MIRSAKSWRPVTAALVVSLGLMVVWALLISWCSTTARSVLLTQNRVTERLQIATDGTPVISTQANQSNIELNRRTLDGQPWPLEYEKWLNGASFPKPETPRGLIEWPHPWQSRIAGGSDGKHPPTAWYLLRNAEPQGGVWFAGFDAMSNRPVGFIGRQGFRTTLPPRDEQWLLPVSRRFGLNYVQAGTQYLDSRSLIVGWSHNLNEEQRPAPWLIYLAVEDCLVEIDLRKRSARTVQELERLQAITTLSWWEPKDQPPRSNATAGESTRPTRARFASLAAQDFFSFPASSAPADSAEQRRIQRFALRTADRIVLFDPMTDEKRELTIPEPLREQDLTAYSRGLDELLFRVDRGHWSDGKVVALVWTTPDGKVVRQEEVQLSLQLPPSERQQAWLGAAAAPVPLAWLTGITLVKPLARLQSGDAESYLAALRQTASTYGPPALGVLVLALLGAGLALRLHRRYHRPRPWLWWLFVFLLGPAGLLAYWIEYHRPPLGECPACSRTVPRDRDDCAVCGEAFAPPVLVGTEIFA